MTQSSQSNICIIGAGLAGMAMARALIQKAKLPGKTITIIFAHSFGDASDGLNQDSPIKNASLTERIASSAASTTPMALLNPATGRYAKLVGQAEIKMEASFRLLMEMEQYSFSSSSSSEDISTEPIQVAGGILRPAKDEEMAQGMISGLANDPWPEGWAEWLSPDELESKYPWISGEFGALWIREGRSVRMPALLKRLKSWLQENGVQFSSAFAEVDPSSNLVRCRRALSSVGDQAVKEYPFEVLICACGAGSADLRSYQSGIGTLGSPASGATFSLWEDGLGLHQVKGQTLTLTLDKPVVFPFGVSKVGYIAPLNAEPEAAAGQPESTQDASVSHLVVGSTYEHRFESISPDHSGAQRLMDIAATISPELPPLVKSISSWSGIRVHRPPDRQPVIERHPLYPRIHSFTGFGSKGLLTIPYEAEKLAEKLFQ